MATPEKIEAYMEGANKLNYGTTAHFLAALTGLRTTFCALSGCDWAQPESSPLTTKPSDNSCRPALMVSMVELLITRVCGATAFLRCRLLQNTAL